MDISSQLISDFHDEDYPSSSNPNISRSEELITTLGWEETQGEPVSKDTASDIKDVVESQTKKVTESPEFDTVTQEAEKSNYQVEFLPHSDIRLGELIGQGGFNQIYDIRSLSEQERIESSPEHCHQYVVKVLRPDLAEDSVRFALCACDIVKEALLMAALDHKHILKLKAVSEGGISSFEHGRRPDAFFMVMGKLEETLDQRIEKWRSHMREIHSRPKDRASFFQERLHVVTDIADALAYMHSLCMIHRDLKPQNMGFDHEGMIKIFDFGMARLVPESKDPDETFQLSQRAGTHRYISPENYKGEPYNLKSDVYSFAILMHQILSLKIPYAGRSPEDHETAVFEQGIRPRIPLVWPWNIRKLLKQGWAQNSSKRLSMHEMHAKLQNELE